jgi:hypothetical protein
MKRKSVRPCQTNPSRSISTHPSAKGVHKDIIISSVYLIAINRERETTVQVFDSLHFIHVAAPAGDIRIIGDIEAGSAILVSLFISDGIATITSQGRVCTPARRRTSESSVRDMYTSDTFRTRPLEG